MSVSVQAEDFDISREVAALTSDRTDIGAIVTFTGTVRGKNVGAELSSMTLEHYPGMTEKELERIEREANDRWPLQASLVIHRVGALAPGDNIVLVVTVSAHREAAFAAAEFLMDYLKTSAPFWKKEAGAGGAERGSRCGRGRGLGLPTAPMWTRSPPPYAKSSVIRGGPPRWARQGDAGPSTTGSGATRPRDCTRCSAIRRT